jgi:site-specific recombinase XerD
MKKQHSVRGIDCLAHYIRTFFEDYLVCRRHLSICTIRSYRDVIALFMRFSASRKKRAVARLLVTDIQESTVVDFLTFLEDKRDNSIQTRNHRLGVLKRFFCYVSLQNPILSDHCRKILDIPAKRGACQHEITYLEKDETRALLAAVDTKSRTGRRDYAILLFMYNTGARVQEACDLRLSWMPTFDSGTVEILGKGNKRRTCPLWPSTVQALRRYIDGRERTPGTDDYVFLNRFHNPISRFAITNIITKYQAIAGQSMPSLLGKNLTPHSIRHTTAMHLLQSGVDISVIQHWLGHANLETTQCYVEIDLEMKRKALRHNEIQGRDDDVSEWRSNPDILKWLESL